MIRDNELRIAQIVRGDRLNLSTGECNEVLHSQISYYTTDVAVIGWNAAFLYDSAAGAETAIQLLEYANSQLLEFRHYDELLSMPRWRKRRERLRGGDWPAPQPACTQCSST